MGLSYATPTVDRDQLRPGGGQCVLQFFLFPLSPYQQGFWLS